MTTKKEHLPLDIDELVSPQTFKLLESFSRKADRKEWTQNAKWRLAREKGELAQKKLQEAQKRCEVAGPPCIPPEDEKRLSEAFEAAIPDQLTPEDFLRWLVETEGWPPEAAREIAVRYRSVKEEPEKFPSLANVGTILPEERERAREGLQVQVGVLFSVCPEVEERSREYEILNRTPHGSDEDNNRLFELQQASKHFATLKKLKSLADILAVNFNTLVDAVKPAERAGTVQPKVDTYKKANPIVVMRNSVILEWYGETERGRKAKITAEKLDKIPGMENDPLLVKWMQLTYAGALKNPSIKGKVKTLFSTTYSRETGS